MKPSVIDAMLARELVHVALDPDRLAIYEALVTVDKLAARLWLFLEAETRRREVAV
jgi:hypothetical protein